MSEQNVTTDDMVPATFAGLLTILDRWYPADVFTASAEDVGARLVVLARELAKLREAARDFADLVIQLLELDDLPSDARAACKRAVARHPGFNDPGENGSSERVHLSVHYAISIPVAKAEELVGRPWTHDDEADDSWECDLEEAVKDHLPDLLDFARDEPDVEYS